MKVGFCGPFCDTNFGDYAMLVNDAMDIGETHITIFSYEIARIAPVIERYFKAFHIVTCNIEVENDAVIVEGRQYTVSYDDAMETPLEVMRKIANLAEVEKEVKRVDKLVVTGGGFLNRIWTARHRKARLFAILSVIYLADMHGKEIVFMGNTIGPFEESEAFFSLFLSSLKHSTWAVRDQIMSGNCLKRLGIDTDVHDLPDDLYFLNSKLCAEPNGVLEKLQNLSEGRPYVLLELYHSLQEIEENMSDFQQFAAQMKQRFHRNVIFVALDQKYGGYLQGKMIEEAVPEIRMWNAQDMEYLPIEELVCLVQNASFVLCERYHLSVLALAHNTPFMQVLKDVCGDKRYYYIKAMGILEMFLEREKCQAAQFLQTSFQDALLLLRENITETEQKQKRLFNENKRRKEEAQREIRKAYIQTHLKKDGQ